VEAGGAAFGFSVAAFGFSGAAEAAETEAESEPDIGGVIANRFVIFVSAFTARMAPLNFLFALNFLSCSTV